jgi:peptidoglycan hydrolase-like protein with peptidoglycan-binding domain
MTMLLQIGIAYPAELSGGIGHVACTLGGVNYESKGSRGCLRGSVARGATNRLFRHQFFRTLADDQARAGQRYADGCVGQPYVWDKVPSVDPKHGGDCSGFVSGIICACLGRSVHRLFSTGSWKDVSADLGFRTGLGGGVIPTDTGVGVADRPYPGFAIRQGSAHPGHIRWIQARLNFAAHNTHPVLHGQALRVDGQFGDDTFKVVVAFQQKQGWKGRGAVGPKTWAKLNQVR